VTAAPRHRLFLTTGLSLAGAALLFPLRAAEPAPTSPATREITALLGVQAAAWNRGDLEGFMQAYAQTGDLRFASGGTVTYGWQPTLERYRQRYPDKAAMGTLAYSDLVVTELAPDAALVFGRWQLTRAKDTAHGLFTLTLKKTAAGWRIIFDHTSSAN
jgi:ketosteroid isomerase-like protein